MRLQASDLPACPAGILARGRGSRSARLAAHLATCLGAGQARSGARLPPVRETAAHFGVDKATAAKAYRELERRGLLQRLGRGSRAVRTVASVGDLPRLPQTILVVDQHESRVQTDGELPAGSPYRLMDGITRCCQARDWSVMLATPAQALAHLTRFSPSAIITLATGSRGSEVARVAGAGAIPLAVYGDLLHIATADTVCSDHATGARQLVLALADSGRRRIAMRSLTGELPWVLERQRGYREALAERRLPILPPIILTDERVWYDPAQPLPLRSQALAGQFAGLMTGDSPPDAILALSDGDALLIGAAMRLFNRRVHEDVAIVGYDDYWRHSTETAQGAPPPLMTVDKDLPAIGAALASLAMARAEGTAPATPQRVLIAPQMRMVGDLPPPGRRRRPVRTRR